MWSTGRILSISAATRARSDSLLLFADSAAAASEWLSLVVYCGVYGALRETIPLISKCLEVWEAARLRITAHGRAEPESSLVYAPATSQQQSLPRSLALPVMLKLKTAAWNTRLMKPCLELFSFSSCCTIMFY